jgi:hypothetical protein
MKSALLLAVLVAVVASHIAGNAVSSNRIRLQPGRRNVLNFACGQADGSGRPAVANTRYNYRFSGQPSWLQQSGSSLAGNAPAGASGSWPVQVTYDQGDGKTSGSSTFLLSFDDQAPRSSANLNQIYYFSGALSGTQPVSADAGNYIILIPFLSAGSTGAATSTGGGSSSSTAANTITQISCARFQTTL